MESALSGADGYIARVQLREQHGAASPAGDEELLALGRELLPVCRRFGAKLVINRRFDLMQAIAADGVHAGGDTILYRELLGLAKPGTEVSFAAHSAAEVEWAASLAPGPIYLSPVFAPLSKDSGTAPLGLEIFRELSAIPNPLIALGGVTGERLAACLDAGASGVAMISAILCAPDVYTAAAQCAAVLTKWRAGRAGLTFR